MLNFEKLGAKAMIGAFNNLDDYMESDTYDSEINKILGDAKGTARQRQMALLTQERFLEIFAVTLLKNYHEALTLIMATQGIDLNAL